MLNTELLKELKKIRLEIEQMESLENIPYSVGMYDYIRGMDKAIEIINSHIENCAK